MTELFEFAVTRPAGSVFSDQDDKRFIKEFLEPRGLLWGGGGNSNSIHGVISTGLNSDLESVLDEFVSFFENTDQIIIRFVAELDFSPSVHLRRRQNVAFEPYTV